MTVVNNNPTRVGSARETSSVSIKLVKWPDVPDSQKVVVKRDGILLDVLWDTAAARLGAGANSAQIARYIEAIKREIENLPIFSAERDGGYRLYAGDEIKAPPTDWSAWKPKGRPADQTVAAAAARAQDDANAALSQPKDAQKEKSTLKTNLEAAVAFANVDPEVLKNGLNPGQRNLVYALLGKAERIAPELLTLTSVQDLKAKARLSAQGESSFDVA